MLSLNKLPWQVAIWLLAACFAQMASIVCSSTPQARQKGSARSSSVLWKQKTGMAFACEERVGTGTQLLNCWTAFSIRHAQANTCGISWSQPFPYFLRICTDNAQAAYSISLQWKSIGKLQSLFKVCCWSWAWEQKPGWVLETCSRAIPVLLLLLYWCTFPLGMFVPE